LPADTFLQLDYRYYFDDWQVRSNAVNVAVTHHLSPTVVAGAGYRWYDQSGAYFYQPQYVGSTPEFFTADFRLQPFTSGLYFGTLSLTPKTFLWFPSGS